MKIQRKIKRLIEIYHQEGFRRFIKFLLAYFFRGFQYKFPKLNIFVLGKSLGKIDNWPNVLLTEKLKKGKRFTVTWYKNHPITKEFLKRGVLKGKVLGLGCGLGTRAFLAVQKNKTNTKLKITGIDISPHVIKYATENFSSNKLNFVCGNVLKMPFKDKFFDNAYMFEVMEHIPNTKKLFAEIKRVVKPKGKLFLSVPERYHYWDPDHAHIFSKKSLRKVLISQKIKILDIYIKNHIIFASVEI